MYPALVNCTTVIYFSEWPSEALIDVAHHFLRRFTFDLENQETVEDSSVGKIDIQWFVFSFIEHWLISVRLFINRRKL